jgi:hypothetical protein
MSSIALSQMSEWFSAKKFALNLHKTNVKKCRPKIHPNKPEVSVIKKET